MTTTIDINDVGKTAFFIAWFRDAERNRPDSLFDDPFAQWFVPDEIRPAAQRFAEVCPEFDDLIRCRLLFFRELVKIIHCEGHATDRIRGLRLRYPSRHLPNRRRDLLRC